MQKNFDRLHFFLVNYKTCYLIHKDMINDINNSLCMLHDNLIKKEIKHDQVDSKSISDILNFICAATFQVNVTDGFLTFLKDYCGIIQEWNKETKNAEISKLCQYLFRFVDDNLTVDEFTNYLINITARLKDSQNLPFEQFKLSEHYFNLVNERVKT